MTPPWWVYPADHTPVSDAERARWLRDDACPPWRRPRRPWADRPDRVDPVLWRFEDPASEGATRDLARARTYVPTGIDRTVTPAQPHEQNQVNLALLLRRPLLVKGQPGIGKSSLAYRIAWMMGLGRPFRWEISSTSSLKDGLYTYDAVGHFKAGEASPIEAHIRLGPLGTVLCPTERPGCLLVDELDKASYDLPNDLLHAFEEGAFRIPELERREEATIRTVDGREVRVRSGEVRCHHHPVVVITTNDEREFPPAFLRRCVVLELGTPQEPELRKIVARHFGGDDGLAELLQAFRDRPTDRLLQALHLRRLGAPLEDVERGLTAEAPR